MKARLVLLALSLNLTLAVTLAAELPPGSLAYEVTQAVFERLGATLVDCGDRVAPADTAARPAAQALCATTRMSLEPFTASWEAAASDDSLPAVLRPLGAWRHDPAREIHERAYDLAGDLYTVRYAPGLVGGELLITHYPLGDLQPAGPLRVTVNWNAADFPLETQVLLSRVFSLSGVARADCTPGAQGADGTWRTACGVLAQPFTAAQPALTEAVETLPGVVVLNPWRQTRAGAYAAGYRFAGREHVIIVQETPEGLDLLLRAAGD